MSKILLLFPPKRIDLFSFLKEDKVNTFYILDDDSENYFQKIKDEHSFIEAIFYWRDYFTPKQLVKKIQPDKIIFGEVFDIKQIALCIYANGINIPTFFIDHGIYGTAEDSAEMHAGLKDAIFKNKLKKISNSILSITKNRFFYYSVITKVSLTGFLSFIRFPLYSFIFSTFKALKKLPFKERTPTHFILFCKKNYSYINSLYFTENKHLYFTGFPYYDRYFNNETNNENYIVYIDAPYLEVDYLGWNKVHHKNIAENLNNFAIKNKVKVYVKLHPISNKAQWNTYQLDPDFVEVVQYGNFGNLYLHAKLILSYSSSLLIGFISAKKNIVLLGWHPKQQITGIDFSEMGLCHISLDVDDLEKNYNKWCEINLCETAKEEYNQFIEDYNYPFDGKATTRILNYINNV